MTTEVIWRSLREAVVTMLAALVTMFCAMAIDPEPGPAILAVVLCLSLSRSQLDRNLRGRLEAAVTLPAVSVAALGVGMLLRYVPWIGAGAFVAGISLSIWLRRFGPLIRRAGSLIALPFVVILTTPYVPTTRVSPSMALLLPIIVALLALFWVSVFHLLARGSRRLPAAGLGSHAIVPAAPAKLSTLRPIASTRMAIQMAVALGVSFVVGYVFFAEHWAWVVLTAFIVGSGNRGRLDVVYKSALRVLGAAAGTLVALFCMMHVGTHDGTTVVMILAAIFLGTWLRPLGYAWWALFVTIALALLQGFEGLAAQHVLWPRLQEIFIGAAIGVTAAWFVLPVRSSDVLRRRIADALVALSEALDPDTQPHQAETFIAALAQVEQVMPAFRASRFFTRSFRHLQPADWVDALLACRDAGIEQISRGGAAGPVRKALGAARKSLRDPPDILPALQELRQKLMQRSA